ncbi:hypothetical protein F5Y04DRAFT_290089 [Hypomontagnella monticulosa]|nr:hypothetical protein F5Y04DRAFT_290089 [Hypomontagnella monticulosa]
MASNNLADQAMAELHHALGILYGIDAISESGHNQILAILAAEQGRNSTKQETDMPAGGAPVGMETSQPTPTQGEGSLSVETQLSKLAIAKQPTRGSTRPSHGSHQGTTVMKYGGGPQIVCPWWLTYGKCRDHYKGRCRFVHANVPGGIQQPLICHFWADGGRCTKDGDSCRFAHYEAAHGVVAPAPTKVYKEEQALTVAVPSRRQPVEQPEWLAPEEQAENKKKEEKKKDRVLDW